MSPTQPTPRPRIELRDLQPGDLGWVLTAHAELYWEEYGWDMAFERLVARVLGEFEPGPRERGWIATVDGVRAGSIFLVRAAKQPDAAEATDGDPGAAPSGNGNGDMGKLRLLLVHPSFRGLGLARALVDACLAFARDDARYAGVELWTHANLAAARTMYAKRGFTRTKEEPYVGLGGHALVAESWEMRF